MLSKSKIKLLKSLRQKKYRNIHGLFIAEGHKTINEFIASKFILDALFTTVSFNNNSLNEEIITAQELKKISLLKTPNKSLALFKIPQVNKINDSSLILGLDAVQDPGNLGAIIRLCDWFGIPQLICSLKTVDCYNPKVVQATMGSLARVQINYIDLEAFLKHYSNTIYGTFMEGETIYNQQLLSKGVIVMGNEANGISKPIEALISKKITIPRFGKLKATESLNVATATAIILNEFKRATTEM